MSWERRWMKWNPTPAGLERFLLFPGSVFYLERFETFQSFLGSRILYRPQTVSPAREPQSQWLILMSDQLFSVRTWRQGSACCRPYCKLWLRIKGQRSRDPSRKHQFWNKFKIARPYGKMAASVFVQSVQFKMGLYWQDLFFTMFLVIL